MGERCSSGCMLPVGVSDIKIVIFISTSPWSGPVRCVIAAYVIISAVQASPPPRVDMRHAQSFPSILTMLHRPSYSRLRKILLQQIEKGTAHIFFSPIFPDILSFPENFTDMQKMMFSLVFFCF